VLISFGAVLGKASVDQLAVVAVLEVVCYAAHKQLVLFGLLSVEDVGGSLSIHLWGAYFGLGCAYALGVPTDRGAAAEGADKKTDVLALLGTTVLFVYWPSFVGAEVTGDAGASTRCTVNTYLALCGSALASFLCSGLGNGGVGLRAVDVQNASLAGGVGIGAIGRLKAVTPGGALAVGLLSGALSTWGYASAQPRLLSTCGLHDTCGVHNLHGMPALLSGVASALFVAVASRDQVYEHGAATPGERAAYQLLGTLATLVAAAVAGVLAGKVANAAAPRGANYVTFHDAAGWDVGEDYESAWDAALDGSKHNATLDGSRKGIDGSKTGKKATVNIKDVELAANTSAHKAV
jgi:ammonium transporter Rh